VKENQQTDRPHADLTPSLVASLRDGQNEAGVLLDELYRENLVRFCASYLGSRDDAEDVVQEVFVKVLETDVVPDNFRAWIYRICRNRCLDFLRVHGRRRHNQQHASQLQLDAELTGNLTHLVRKEQRSQLRRLLIDLPANQREVLHLRYAEGLTRAEIAHVLDLPEPLVKSRLYDGIQRLRRHASLKG